MVLYDVAVPLHLIFENCSLGARELNLTEKLFLLQRHVFDVIPLGDQLVDFLTLKARSNFRAQTGWHCLYLLDTLQLLFLLLLQTLCGVSNDS